MTEEQIKDGYDRLDSSLHPPMDAFDRVEKRMTLRRRRRWAGTAAGAALVVAAVGGYAAVSGSSDDGRDGLVAVEPPSRSLVMTRPDGSTYEFEDLTISCDPRGSIGAGDLPADGTRVYLSSPVLLDGKRLEQPFVFMQVAVGEEEREFTLPLQDDDPAAQDQPFTIFIGDTEGAPDGNEVVSDSSSTGTFVVTRASCDPTPVLELEVDLTLASEEQTEAGRAKQSLVLTGAVR